MINTESQRVPLCSPMPSPEASWCSYCDLLASKCIMFSVCCSSTLQADDEYRSPDAARWSLGALVAPTKDFFFLRYLYALSSLEASSMNALRREETWMK